MRRFVALAVLLASGTSAAWVDREPPIVAGTAQPRADRVLLPARNLPAGWQGTRDRDTGAVTQLWGSYVAVPGSIANPAIAERAARAFAGTHLDVTELRVVANQLDGTKRTVGFEQTWRGMRVVGAQVHVVFEADRLFVVQSTALPEIRAAIPATPRASTVRAEAWVAAAVNRPVRVRSVGDRVVLPVASGFVIADVIELEAVTGLGRWDVYIAADGAPLLRVDRLRAATGTLTYDAGVRRPTGPRMAYPASAANITVDGSATTTADDGDFTWAGTANAMVVPGLIGTAVTIVNAAGALATTTLTAQPAGSVAWSLATDELGDAQLTAFVHASIGKARARALMPSLATWLDESLEVHVNESGECNAVSTGDDIHFFRGSPMCENTARLADVVYHELGHSIHFHAIIPGAGAFQAALSEGLSDFFAANLLEDQALGRGFFLDDRPVRELDPIGDERVWPEDRTLSPHLTGLIVAGALWDLRKALITTLGPTAGIARAEALYVGVMQRAADLPSSYLAALTADDDDGNLGNGTPNSCAIEAAFGKHGLAGAGFQTTRVGVPVVDGRTITVPVTIPAATTCAPPQITSMTLTYRVGTGSPSTLSLSPSGTSWTTTLPELPDHTLVHYAITAILDDQSTVLLPDNPADPEYQLYVGTPDEIWCERFDADPQWTQTGTMEWQVTTPRALSGDPVAAFSGLAVLGTDVDGDGRYATGSTTAITTPPIDVSAYDQVRLHYRRWLTVEDAEYDQATIAVNGQVVWTNATTLGATLTHTDREWRFHGLDLTPHATGPIAITWALTSDNSRELGGWTLDDVCVVGIGKRAVCGDGILDDGETCDDGNGTSGDGCDDACGAEDDGGCCSAGSNPTGPVLLSVGLLVVLGRRRRRSTLR